MLAAMVVMTITMIEKITYILLRLPFGVANGPNDFCLVSEMVMDLTNDILRNNTWSPKTIHSPLQKQFDKPKEQYPDTEKYSEARPLLIYVPFHPAVADGYIDDVITVMLDEEDWVEKGQNAAPLAVHTTFRPIDKRDILPRDDVTSIRKMEGEGTPDERKKVIGWIVDTRNFRIYLPRDKASMWQRDINYILQHGPINSK